jgi:hypothetical protein
MPAVVNKYFLEGRSDIFTLLMPHYAKILHLTLSEGKPTIFAQSDPSDKRELRRFQMFPNGFTIPDDAWYIGSLALHANDVTHDMHFFEIPIPREERDDRQVVR